MTVTGDGGPPNQAERRRWNDATWTESWIKREPMTALVTPVLLEALDLQPGQRVLDVGCGGGRTSLAAAGLVGPQGAVVGADISGPLVALASRRAVEAGAANVSFVAADMQVDHVGAGHFDVAMSQLGVMFFEDPVAAFANIRRHLGDGGRIGFVCWQSLDRNPWCTLPVLAPFLPPPVVSPGPRAPGPFSLGRPDEVSAILRAAGYAEIACAGHELSAEVSEETVFDDAQLTTMGVPGASIGAARAAAAGHLSRFRRPGGELRFPLAFQVFTAVPA